MFGASLAACDRSRLGSGSELLGAKALPHAAGVPRGFTTIYIISGRRWLEHRQRPNDRCPILKAILIWSALGSLVVSLGIAALVQRRRHYWRKRRLRGDPEAKVRELQRRRR